MSPMVPDEMRKVVRLVLRAGADWIKLIATRGVLAASDGGFDPELSFEELAVAVSEAGRRHRPVMVHALGGDAIGWAIEAGARSIEHGIFLTEADAATMAARGLLSRADPCHIRAVGHVSARRKSRGGPCRTGRRGR